MSEVAAADGGTLHWTERPASTPVSEPFFFQHGMGGDLSQPLSYLQGAALPRTIFVDARGHGASGDLAPETASFDRFADDVIAVADSLEADRFAMGGISLGAGTALNLALRYPERITALVLCRPAWLDAPQSPFNRETYSEIADLLDADGAARGVEVFATSDRYRQVLAESPAAAQSLLGQFTRSRAAENSVVLRALPADRPSASAESWKSIAVPTVVIGHRDDPFHPFSIAEAYAEVIPGAQLIAVPSKDADASGFRIGIRSAISTFLSTEKGHPER